MPLGFSGLFGLLYLSAAAVASSFPLATEPKSSPNKNSLAAEPL